MKISTLTCIGTLTLLVYYPSVQLFRDESDFPFAPDPRFASRKEADDTDRDLYSLHYERQAPGSWLSHLSLLGYLQRADLFEDEAQRRFGPTGSFVQTARNILRTTDFDTWGAEIRGVTSCQFSHHRHLLTYGFEYFRDEAAQRQRTDTTILDSGEGIVRRDSITTTQFVEPYVTGIDPTTRERLRRAYQARTLAFAGLVLLHQGREEDARERYRQAYALLLTDPFAAHYIHDEWIATATTLLQQGSDREAQALLSQVLDLAPASLTSRFLLAQTLLAQGQTGRTLTELRCIETIASAFPGLQLTLGHLLQVLGRRAEANGGSP